MLNMIFVASFLGRTSPEKSGLAGKAGRLKHPASGLLLWPAGHEPRALANTLLPTFQQSKSLCDHQRESPRKLALLFAFVAFSLEFRKSCEHQLELWSEPNITGDILVCCDMEWIFSPSQLHDTPSRRLLVRFLPIITRIVNHSRGILNFSNCC